MTAVPFIPDNAPFTTEQRAWLNGFFAGMFSRGTQPAAVTAPPVLTPLTILFGSQTGTAESLAKKAAKEAGKRNFAATVLDMAQTDLAKLAGEKNVLVITSTYGDGEPPDNAKALHAALGAGAGSLAGVRFSVCGLGDTNYAQFCRCAQDFDAWLEKAGATRALARAECDLEYEEKFNAWLEAALAALAGSEFNVPSSESGREAPPKVETGYSRQKPYAALLVTSRTLNGAGSAKQVNHVEFDLGDSGLVYEAGDALGVYAQNCPELVNDVLSALGCDGEEAVPAPDGSSIPLRRALTEFYDLGKPSDELRTRCGGVSAGPHVVDALAGRVSVKIAPTDFVKSLKKLQPRLYSISSSPKAHPGRVHLTVGAVRYEKEGRARKGVCSTFLAERAQAGVTRVGVFVHANKAFRPPADSDAPMIMVGPGTGIAPFRAFLEERQATGAKGKNWLFFGDQRTGTDFLYREEIEEMQRSGVLTRLDTAFSRDQAEKIYVQQRMLENAMELFAWLEQGAHFYVCGDASRMAKDVDAALHQVIERAGGKSKEQAAEYVEKLKAAKRYARDVY